jgi:hypothetical protein
VRLSVKSSTGVADPRDMKRGISCPRQRNKSPGAPSFALLAKGGIPRISIPTVAYPTLCKERKGWGTRLFGVLPAVSNTNRGLIENLFLLRIPRSPPGNPRKGHSCIERMVSGSF